MTIQIFEPAMCCSTGVCGPEVDSTLVTFAGDVKWLKAQGVTVHRFNLSRTPDAFVETRIVYEALMEGGMDVLPLLVVEGEIVSRGRYPARNELAAVLEVVKSESTASSAAAERDPAGTLFTNGGGNSSCC